MLLLFTELAAVGLMTAMSFKASALEAEALSKKPKHLSPTIRAPPSPTTDWPR